MKVLELFCGTAHISKEFASRGHETFTVDWDTRHNPTLTADIGTLTVQQVIDLCGGRPDMIWAAPDCTTFSMMAMWKHRRKNYVTGEMDPISDYARRCDEIDRHVMKLILNLNPKVYIIENPCGGLRTMHYMRPMGSPQLTTYCQYGTLYGGEERQPCRKPTDFFSNFDLHLKRPCNVKDDCHVHGKQGIVAVKNRVLRSMYPDALVTHMVDEVENYLTSL